MKAAQQYQETWTLYDSLVNQPRIQESIKLKACVDGAECLRALGEKERLKHWLDKGENLAQRCSPKHSRFLQAAGQIPGS